VGDAKGARRECSQASGVVNVSQLLTFRSHEGYDSCDRFVILMTVRNPGHTCP